MNKPSLKTLIASVILIPNMLPLATSASSQNCVVSTSLVNECRAWVGAAVHGNPGAPSDPISQFNYLEQLTGNHLDIYRDYHAPLSDTKNSDSSLPADPSTKSGQVEIQLAKAGKLLDLNWDVSHTWSQAAPVSEGGDPSINAQIDQAAANIKKLPYTVFLSPWHEANLHVSSKDSSSQTCSHFNTQTPDGTPSQFVTAWRNIYNKFKADDVTNVVWVLNYGSYDPDNCWVTYMWPGNNYVDWVIYDTYSRGKTWQDTSGSFYTYLSQHSSPSADFNSKPWGIGEFGTCKQPATGISATQYFQTVTSAVQANTYPNLRMYLIYADTGNNSGQGCLTNYDDNGQKDSAKQAAFNQLVSAILGSSIHPTPSPSAGLGSTSTRAIPTTGSGALLGLTAGLILAASGYLYYRYHRRKNFAITANKTTDPIPQEPPESSI